MKKVLLLILLLVANVSANDLYVKATNVIELGDLGTDVRDTFTVNFDLEDFPQYTYWWRTVQIGSDDAIDTLFGADTVFIMTEHSFTNRGPWTAFDSIEVILNGNADTVLNLAVRINTDSASYMGNWLRAKVVHGFSIGNLAADTAVVGNDYSFDIKYWLEGK